MLPNIKMQGQEVLVRVQGSIKSEQKHQDLDHVIYSFIYSINR